MRTSVKETHLEKNRVSKTAKSSSIFEETQQELKPLTRSASQSNIGFLQRMATGQFAIGSEVKPRGQDKIKIGRPGDKYKQGANRVAEQIMSIPEPAIKTTSTFGVTDEVTSHIGNKISSIKSQAKPLPESTLDFFEAQFGADFRKVKLYTNGKAAQIASEIEARAFTIGNSIVFGPGQYSPETTSGKKLLAHELTHVVQQRSPLTAPAYGIVPKDNLAEREAAENARAVTERKPLRKIEARLSASDIARDYASFMRRYPDLQLEADLEAGAILVRGCLRIDEEPLTRTYLEQTLDLPQGSLLAGEQLAGLWIFEFSPQFLVNGAPNQSLYQALRRLPIGSYLREDYLRTLRPSTLRRGPEHGLPSFETEHPIYTTIINGMRLNRSFWLTMLNLRVARMTGVSRDTAGRMISAYEGISDWCIRISLGIIGVLGGLVSGVYEGVRGLFDLITGIFLYFALFLFGFFGAEFRERFYQYDAEIQAALNNLLPALEEWFSGWWQMFQSASEDQKTVMLAEAMGHIVAIITAFEAVASRVGAGTTIPTRFSGGAQFALPGGGAISAGGVLVAEAESASIVAGGAAAGGVGTGQLIWHIRGEEEGTTPESSTPSTTSESERGVVGGSARRTSEVREAAARRALEVREAAADMEIQHMRARTPFTIQERAALVRRISEGNGSLTPELRAELRPSARGRDAPNITPERVLEIREEMLQRRPLLRELDNVRSSAEIEPIMREFGRQEGLTLVRDASRANPGNVSVRREPGNLLFDPDLPGNPYDFFWQLRHDMWYYYLELPSNSVGYGDVGYTEIGIIEWLDMLPIPPFSS